MEKENLKILSYEKGVSELPDYPSDKGIGAEELKAVFDARSNSEIKEKHNALVDAVASETETLSAKDTELEKRTDAIQNELLSLTKESEEHANDKNNPHGITLRQLGFEGTAARLKLVSSDDNLSSIIPEEGELCIIEYKNLPIEDAEGNITVSEKTVYLLKAGNGKNSLSELPTMQNVIPGDGEGSFSQFIESEAKGYKKEGVYYYPRSVATEKGAVALGRYNKVSGSSSMAVNYDNEVRAQYAFAANLGNFIPVNAQGAFVTGHGNKATNEYQAIFGTYADAKDNDIFVVGFGGSEGNRQNALRVNDEGKVYADGQLVAEVGIVSNGPMVFNGDATYNKDMINKGYVRLGNFNFSPETIQGEWSYAYGLGSAAFGRNNKVHGKHSFAALSSNTIPQKTADGKYEIESVFVAGHGNTATEPHQAIFGTYSSPEANDAFVVGNGSSSVRKNAFAVNKDGSVRIGGNQITVGKTVVTEENIKALLNLVSASGESV